MDWRKHRLEVNRKRRLHSKAQKANCLDKIEVIEGQPSWNKRFNLVQRLRANG